MTVRSPRAAWALFLAASLSGCGQGSTLVPVSGKVVFDEGGVVRSGIIELTSVDNRHTARSRISPDGTFHLGTHTNTDGAYVGRYRVIVAQIVPVEDVPATGHAPHGLVHEKYADYATSGLTAEIPPKGVTDLLITVSQGAAR